MFDRIGGLKVFWRLDLKTGFHQVSMKRVDVEKTELNTKYGQLEYLFIPMGACNAPENFQSLINQIFPRLF